MLDSAMATRRFIHHLDTISVTGFTWTHTLEYAKIAVAFLRINWAVRTIQQKFKVLLLEGQLVGHIGEKLSACVTLTENQLFRHLHLGWEVPYTESVHLIQFELRNLRE
jgi:hypothetical protein